jgi:hypothetical protein
MKYQPILQAHCQSPTSQRLSQSFVKELAKPTHRQKDIAANLKDNKTRKINNETLTKAICNKGFRGNSSILPRSNFGVGGQARSPQSLTAHSLNRCA